MAKRRRRKITIKNSSLFAFFALMSLFLLDENSAYQHQNPYRYSSSSNKQPNNNQLQRHNYLLNIQQAPTPLAYGSAPGGSSSSTTSTSLDPSMDPQQLRSSQSSSFISQQNFQESTSSKQIQQQSTAKHNQKHNTLQQQHHQQFAVHQSTTITTSQLPSVEHLCSKLPSHLAKQLKLCKLISHSPNVDNVVSLGATKGLAECRLQFRHDRWNCTHAAGDHHLLTSELTQSIGNPESGFIHAIAAAGIVHSIATACSVGNLSDCACDRGRVGTIASKRDEPSSHWKWGGCSNNIRHGMMFAKHFVELLDAVHQHTRLVQLQHHYNDNQQQQHHHHHQQQLQYRQLRQHHNHLLSKRATTIITSRDHLSTYHRPPETLIPAVDSATTVAAAAAAQRDFCQQNQNISQAKHHELIKSLLSRNSLEKHQEFRLAMNMHNNKIGRMAVAKNMIFHCRCHGLSGTCSLKTCWLTLPDLQVISKYLKKKYEKSVHLPKAVNLNKLIPMMDRQEISSILSSSSSSSHSVESDTDQWSKTEFMSQDRLQPPTQSPQPHHVPEFAALVHSNENGSSGQPQDQVEHTADEQASITPTLAPVNVNSNISTADERLSLYVNHRLQQQQQQWPTRTPKPPVTTQAATTTTMNEIPNNLEPLSQQQYQALLKEMKLCNTPQVASHLQTRDLNQLNVHYQSNQNNNNNHHHQLVSKHHNKQLSSVILNGQQTKQANLQLSHLLPQNDKDELIHLHKSPNYCDADLRHGFMGIQSRICSNVENAPDNCDRLCCGRGHREMILETRTSCNCQFQFCCTMTCGLCAQKTKVLVCN